MTFHLRNVAIARISAYEAKGWRVVGRGHRGDTLCGFWSVLMRWDGPDPVEPEA